MEVLRTLGDRPYLEEGHWEHHGPGKPHLTPNTSRLHFLWQSLSAAWSVTCSAIHSEDLHHYKPRFDKAKEYRLKTPELWGKQISTCTLLCQLFGQREVVTVLLRPIWTLLLSSISPVRILAIHRPPLIPPHIDEDRQLDWKLTHGFPFDLCRHLVYKDELMSPGMEDNIGPCISYISHYFDQNTWQSHLKEDYFNSWIQRVQSIMGSSIISKSLERHSIMVTGYVEEQNSPNVIFNIEEIYWGCLLDCDPLCIFFPKGRSHSTKALWEYWNSKRLLGQTGVSFIPASTQVF